MDGDGKHEVSKVRVTSFLHSSSHEAWPSQWQASEDGGGGAGTANGMLGTSPESWHTAPHQPPQLIAPDESVCGQQAECYQPVPPQGDSCPQDERSSTIVQTDGASSGDGVSDQQSLVEQSSLDVVKMRDECESALPSFSRRRRYKVREGQAKSDVGGSGASSSSDQSAGEKLSDSQSASHSEQSSEPGSPSSSRNGDNISEPSSPLNLDTTLPSAWLPAPPEETSETDNPDYSITIPPPDDWSENQAGPEKSGSNGDDGADDDEEEEVPAVVEGKFKNLYQYKEKVRKLSDADDDAYDPSITTVIQLDEAELSEPEEDVSSHDEMSQEELGAQLSRLEVSGPDLNVQAPSDESSRDSSSEPEQEDLRLRIKRSSSLKCGKTPPGTPGCGNSKKIVRFADSLGLDLAAIRTFLEGVPNVPKSAFGDLEVQQSDDDTDSHQCSPATSHSSVRPTSTFQPKRMLMPLFQQPFALTGFIDRVKDQKVVLENVSVGDDMSVRGYVRVLNIDFHKHVVVRYTFDGWRNFHEATATYVTGSCDGFSDRFSFLLWGSFLQENGSLTFCIKYSAAGGEFWDNNRGTNYVLQCYCNQAVRPPPLHQQSLHQSSDLHRSIYSRNFGGGGGSSFQNSPPTPSDTWMAGFF